MTVHVIDSQGRRHGVPGKKSLIYPVQKYGGTRVANYPVAATVYKSTATSVSPNTWTAINFDSTPFPSATYGTPPSMWSPTQTYPAYIYIIESGWYNLSASIKFATSGVGGSTVFYVGFRIYTYNGGQQLLAGRMHCPNQYEFSQSGEVVYYLTAGEAVRLDVVQTYTAALNLYGGISNAGLSVAKVCS